MSGQMHGVVVHSSVVWAVPVGVLAMTWWDRRVLIECGYEELRAREERQEETRGIAFRQKR